METVSELRLVGRVGADAEAGRFGAIPGGEARGLESDGILAWDRGPSVLRTKWPVAEMERRKVEIG